VPSGQPYQRLSTSLTAGRAAIVCLIAIAAAAASTCGGETAVETLVGPDGVRCQTTLGGPSAPVPPGGGAVNVTITAARDCTWTATSDASWMQLNATSGQGNATLGVTVARNDVPTARTGAIVVNNQRVTVSQQPLVCTFALRASPQNVAAEGGRGSISIETPTGCTWTATSSAAWLRVLTAAGSGPGPAEFEVAVNDGDHRQATIAIGGQNVTITQDGRGQPGGGGTGSCSISIAPSTVNAPAAAGTHNIAVTAGSGCNWNASTSSPQWLTVSPDRGSGNGSLTLTVARNPGGARTATVTVGTQAATVNQAAAPVCTATIDSASATVAATAGERSVRVTTQEGCEWTASGGDPSWTQILTPRGTGTGDARYSVAAHTGTSPRSTTLTIAGHSHTVTQEAPAAPTCTYTLQPTSQDHPFGGGPGNFSVTTQPPNCAWTASSNQPGWASTTSSGTGNGPVSYTVQPNSGGARQATITVSGGGGSASHSVTQQPQPPQTCTFSLSSSSQNFPANGGPGQFDVNTQPNCNWQAQAGDPTWVNISSGSGSGTKTVVYSVSNNSSTSSRSTSISISGSNVSHSVTQAGQAPTCTYSVQPGSQQFTAAGGTGNFTVNTQQGCAWTLSGGAGWITNVTQNGNAVSYTVQANASAAQRQASFTVSFSGGSQSHTVTQLP
jgi:hypothetical protein